MVALLNELLLTFDQWHRKHWRQIKILLLGLLQFGTGLLLHSSDRERGTPLIIEQSGIVTVDTFALIIGVFGVAILALTLTVYHHLNAANLVLLTTPLIAYIIATIHGAISGQQSAQGAFIYFMLYLITLNGIKGSDYNKDCS